MKLQGKIALLKQRGKFTEGKKVGDLRERRICKSTVDIIILFEQDKKNTRCYRNAKVFLLQKIHAEMICTTVNTGKQIVREVATELSPHCFL